MIIKSLIGLIILIFTNFILIIDSPFQTASDLIQNFGKQHVYASSDGEDDGNVDESENDGSNEDSSEQTDNDKDMGEISVDESDNSNDLSSSEDSVNEQLTAGNPQPITGEIVTGEPTFQFENTDNLQIAPPSTDDQTIQEGPAVEAFNHNFKILKDAPILEQFPLDPIQPQIAEQLNPYVKLGDLLTQQPGDPIQPQIAEQLSPFVDLDDILKEQSSAKTVQSTDPIQSPSYGTVDSEDTEETSIVQQPSTGLTDAVPPETPPDISISGDTVVIPGPSYSEENPSLEECVVENCDIPLYKDEIVGMEKMMMVMGV